MLRYAVVDPTCNGQLCNFLESSPVKAVVGRVQLLRRLSFKREFFVPFIPTKCILLLFPTRDPLEGITVKKETVDHVSNYLKWLKEKSGGTFKVQEFLVCTFSGCVVLTMECQELLLAMSILSLAQDDDAPGIGYRRVLSFPCEKDPVSEEYLSCNYYAIPTCTICAERLEPTLTGFTFRTCRCPPDRECMCVVEHSSCIVCQTAIEMQRGSHEICCDACQLSGDPWICLVCGFVGCSRYQAQHASQHFLQQKHLFSMSLLTQQIWDYDSDAFVHRIVMTFDTDTGTVQRVQYPDRDNPPTTLEDDDAGDFIMEKAKKKHINAKYDSELETSNEKLALMIKDQLDLHRAEYEGVGKLHQHQEDEVHSQRRKSGCCEFGEYSTMNVNKYHIVNRQRWLLLFLENQRLMQELRRQEKEAMALKESQHKLESELRNTVGRSATEDLRLTGEILNLQETIKDIELNFSVQRELAEKLEGGEYKCLRVVSGVEKADRKRQGR
ncbi:hypothetical protein TRSC58_02031 [Trypanosoma rangeli SC58]|uniref:UBP-type domain-containing protein n=1 Tax=Trypanosoma rangeli SC58 TaxID=429131 RepID=A0A061J5U0_TRYRA|nr:hypothetical protein TRSC58_02031 [Trypanosoma rangeli SC58]